MAGGDDLEAELVRLREARAQTEQFQRKAGPALLGAAEDMFNGIRKILNKQAKVCSSGVRPSLSPDKRECVVFMTTSPDAFSPPKVFLRFRVAATQTEFEADWQVGRGVKNVFYKGPISDAGAFRLACKSEVAAAATEVVRVLTDQLKG